MDHRWQNIIRMGPAAVIGTPFLFSRKLLNSYRFNSRASWSDDTDLCGRLRKAGRSVGYSYLFQCYEVGQDTLKAVKARFRNYGKSDREYFLNNYKRWDIVRVIQSLLHPFNEFKVARHIKFIPFVIYCVLNRYWGYANAPKKERKNNS